MLQRMRKFQGQSTLEYAVLVVIVIAALLSLQVYIKRGLQGRLRSATDDIGDQFTTANGINFTKTVKTYSKTKDTLANGVSVSTQEGTGYTNTTENVILPAESAEYGSEGLSGYTQPGASN